MKILVLGGTHFLGRHFVDSALAGGHDVTTFTRGQTNPELHPEVEKLRGDRDGGLEALEGRSWDAVVDTSGYVPRVVGDSARLLSGSVGRYLFVSSISVYSDMSRPVGEDSPVGTMEDESNEVIDGDTYGPLKVLCENVVLETYDGRATVVRPGLIVGPNDPTDRFTYWPARLARGGRILAPGSPDRQVQFIDVRDLAEWMLLLVERETEGTFNATGLEPPITMGRFLEDCRKVAGGDSEIIWAKEDFLLENEAGPWMELPMWVPESMGMAGLMHADVSRAIENGMTFRPATDTISATLEWFKTLPEGYEMKAGMAAEKEEQLLTKLAAQPEPGKQ